MPPAIPLADHGRDGGLGDQGAHRRRQPAHRTRLEHREPEELAHEIGRVLKIVMEQLAVLLKARAAAKVMAKSSKRTMVVAEGNNPLKFIPTPPEIIEVMFARRRPGYLDAQSAASRKPSPT